MRLRQGAVGRLSCDQPAAAGHCPWHSFELHRSGRDPL